MKVAILVLALFALTAFAEEAEETLYQQQPEVEYFGLPSGSQIRNGVSSGLRTGAKVAGGVSKVAGGVSNVAGKVASGAGAVGKVANGVSNVAGKVSGAAGKVQHVAGSIPNKYAQKAASVAGSVSHGAGQVSNAARKVSSGSGMISKGAHTVQNVAGRVSSGARSAQGSLNRAANKVGGSSTSHRGGKRGRELEFFVDEPVEFVYEPVEFIDEPVEFVDFDAVEDFNLPNRQQVANGFHKAGNVAGTVSNVAGKVSNYAGKASSGLHWVGNKIGGKELEDEYVIVYLDEPVDLAEFVDVDAVEDFNLSNRQ